MIRYDVANGIGTITIDRPEERNAMTFAMRRCRLASGRRTTRRAVASFLDRREPNFTGR
jgi:hypothetical protein